MFLSIPLFVVEAFSTFDIRRPATSLTSTISKPTSIYPRPEFIYSFRKRQTRCCLVTEEDVLEAVEEAEQMWAKALDARKTANALSDRAEEEAEASASTSKEVDELFRTQRNNSQPITMEQLAQADAAAKSNLDAGSIVKQAVSAVEEADRLETLAEEALQRSEEKLEQHLADFPDSSLAQ